jgi:hypothetical protein
MIFLSLKLKYAQQKRCVIAVIILYKNLRSPIEETLQTVELINKNCRHLLKLSDHNIAIFVFRFRLCL